ncbi:hypothetical protein IEN91_05400 [Bacillus velezensis]|uniref:hypothetical protein n=1 Tax=Bacillus velezensis TaxID=492670 RepID=UPI0018C84461|nr:hypothetical protein [Bacillus velezensis]QPK89875.1 hypothetical protein IEN91_05400 [Bacillus velezensis]
MFIVLSIVCALIIVCAMGTVIYISYEKKLFDLKAKHKEEIRGLKFQKNILERDLERNSIPRNPNKRPTKIKVANTTKSDNANTSGSLNHNTKQTQAFDSTQHLYDMGLYHGSHNNNSDDNCSTHSNHNSHYSCDHSSSTYDSSSSYDSGSSYDSSSSSFDSGSF